jgi:hypothetical protein
MEVGLNEACCTSACQCVEDREWACGLTIGSVNRQYLWCFEECLKIHRCLTTKNSFVLCPLRSRSIIRVMESKEERASTKGNLRAINSRQVLRVNTLVVVAWPEPWYIPGLVFSEPCLDKFVLAKLFGTDHTNSVNHKFVIAKLSGTNLLSVIVQLLLHDLQQNRRDIFLCRSYGHTIHLLTSALDFVDLMD